MKQKFPSSVFVGQSQKGVWQVRCHCLPPQPLALHPPSPSCLSFLATSTHEFASKHHPITC
eukprot:1372411-Amphidinium_carterae.1